MSPAKEFVVAAFAAVDAMDIDRVAQLMHERVTFSFGNSPAVEGRDPVRAEAAGFLALLGGIRHDIEHVWEVDDHILTRMRVTYTRKDGSKLSCPAMTVWQMRDSLIFDYRIYVDNSTLFPAT